MGTPEGKILIIDILSQNKLNVIEKQFDVNLEKSFKWFNEEPIEIKLWS